MKKLVILLLAINIIFAQNTEQNNSILQNNQKDKYLEYTNKIITFGFELKNIEKIRSPFYNVAKGIKIYHNYNSAKMKKSVKITLLSILGKQAYVKIDVYLGEQLIKTNKKWIRLNDKIYDCRLIKLTYTDAYFKCGKRTLYKTINKKILKLRDTK